MKKCPYCAELIQEEAIKCKHCNEMLNKENQILSFFNDTKDKFIENYKKYRENQLKHLKLPTNDEGWIIGNTHFFNDSLYVEDLGVLNYSEIVNVFFRAESIRRGIITNRTVLFGASLYAIDDNDNKTEDLVEIKFITDLKTETRLNKKSFETVNMLYNHIAKVTYNNRFIFYLKCLREQQQFEYMDFTFKLNGEVYNKKNKLVANLNDLNIEDVSFSSNWSGMNAYQDNPYEFKILNGIPQIKLFGFIETGHSVKIQTIKDNDIFHLLIFHFLKRKFYPQVII